MIIIKTPDELQTLLDTYSTQGKRTGFVPTMGALHKGHLSLLKLAKKNADISICSIFVNPTQFNNPEDLLKYPRNIPKDILLLESAGCDILFLPEEKSLYGAEKTGKIDLKGMDLVLEGASRPGHFDGVARVVKLFFELVKPTMAFFGRKDFQQCMVIQEMVKQFALPVQLFFAETIREENGLAMSSRNERLSTDMRDKASVIYRALVYAKDNYSGLDPAGLKKQCKQLIESDGTFKTDYFEICDSETLQSISSWNDTSDPVALTAVYAGDVRLIDNLSLKNS